MLVLCSPEEEQMNAVCDIQKVHNMIESTLMSGNIKAADYKRNETLTPACLPVISD
jgi:hypothetical protein